ncbi:hypothetical protein C8R46DRAFT_1069184 [Mycena filopes]|nr:hypothetical protein C8R46DRAFT_1069184 [Mycena filopes]
MPGLAPESEDEDENEPEANTEPPRQGRTRRVSEKEAQRLADIEEAEARKINKANKAAQKQRERVEPRPLKDTIFTSREVPLPPKKVKMLQQRDTRIPAIPVTQTHVSPSHDTSSSQELNLQPRQDAAYSQDARYIQQRQTRPPGPSHSRAAEGADNWRKSVIVPPTQIEEERRPRSINGNVFPARVHVDLRYAPELPPARLPRSQPTPRSSPSSRSLSPQAGDKRSHSPEDDVRATQAQKITDHQGRVRAKDYDDTTQELISIANTWFRCLLATKNAFPDHVTELDLVKLAWAKACEELKVDMPLPPDIAKLVARRGAQMRGELKTKVRALTELVFGFESGQNKKNVRKNRQLAEDLKEGMGFCYKVSPAVAAERKGLYKAKIIQKAINVMWFNNRRDEGATHPDIFGPLFPKPALCLVLSAIECCIDEWATGIKTDVPFTSADYRSVYEEHVKCLDEFEEHTSQRADILGNILTRLHNIGRFHSGAQPIAPVASMLSLSRAALDAAVREFEEDPETESDGENGERSE